MTAVDAHTGEVIPQLSAAEAAELTRDIAGELDFAWSLITRAYQGRAWAALGYRSWDEYCHNEFGSSRLALPREERSEVVQSLRSQGLSLRAIAAATGASKSQVERDLSTVPNGTVGGDPTPITGVNGKSYQPTQPAKTTTRESTSTTTEYPQPDIDPEIAEANRKRVEAEAALLKLEEEQRDARILVDRIIGLIQPDYIKPGFVESWVRAMTRVDGDLGDRPRAVRIAADTLTQLADLMEQV